MERYEEAITVLKKALHNKPDFFTAHVNLAESYAPVGREEVAHAEAAEVLRIKSQVFSEKICKKIGN